MGIRSIQFFALGLLSAATAAIAIQTTPSDAANVCRLAAASDEGAIELAAMFTPDAEFTNANLFRNAPILIYATNDVAREYDGVTLVDVSNVTSCAQTDNVI